MGLAILAWIATAGAAVRSDELSFATDLTRDAEVAREKRLPILILFVAPNCAYCERVRHDFLLPMQRNPEYANKVIFRQLYLKSGKTLLDFAGKKTSHSQFAKQNQIKFTPTVKLFDADGNSLTEPLVGLTTPDFYGSYLDGAIDEALVKTRALSPP
ncbi:MAG: thioredoxin fold domain-containing protein [Sulfuricella sp.]